MSKYRNFEILLPGIKKNISLKDYTTFKIGGPAKYFFVAKTKEDLILAIKMAKKFSLPFFVLGGGSNLLVSDKGFSGLVIKCQMSNVKCQNSKVEAGAGVLLSHLVNLFLSKKLSGLEWAVGIPGTVGGAVYGNAGAFGKSMANVVKKIEIFDTKDLRSKIYNLKDCQFGYRNSIFKKNKNLIILSTEIHLKGGGKRGIQKKVKEYLNYKKTTQPLNFPSAGSIFKNPPGFFAGELGEEDKSSSSATERAKLSEGRKERIFFDFAAARLGEETKVSSSAFTAARLIEECGLKGKRIGNVKISEKHANFVVNLGQGKAKDVKKLINLAKKKVKNRFKINLEEEICYLGFKN